MENQKILSIIIPTYNMEKYLPKCLDSLISAKEVLCKMEILIINDGSKDASSRIAHEYQSRYPDSIIVIDKENGNYGSCVNRGLKEATGKYIKVLDADDWFLTQNLKRYIDVLAAQDVDLVLTDFDTITPNGKVINKVRYDYPKNVVLDIERYCGKQEFMKMQMHAVTYRTSMLKNIGYHQSEGISYTDVEWIFEPMSYVKSFCYTGITIYQYLIGREGQTMDPSQMNKHIEHTLKGMYAILDAYMRRVSECGEGMRQYMQAKINIRLGSLYSRSLLKPYLDMETIIKLDNYIKEKDMNVYRTSDNIVIHKLLPLCYVRYWRSHGKKELPSWMKIIYDILLRINKVIKKY